MFEFIFVVLISAGAFFYWYGKKTPKVVVGNSISKITMTQELLDRPTPKGDIQQPNIIEMNIVGVSYKNDDGTSRQKLIKLFASEGTVLDLDFYVYNTDVACGVYIADKQIGHLDSYTANNLFDFIKKGGYAQAYVVSTGKAEDTNKYGVTISLQKLYRK